MNNEFENQNNFGDHNPEDNQVTPNSNDENSSTGSDDNVGNVGSSTGSDDNTGNVGNPTYPDYNAGSVNNPNYPNYNAGNVNYSNNPSYNAGNVNYSNNPADNASGANNSSNPDYNQNWNGQNSGQYAQYGGNPQYKWNYDDYQKAINQNNKPLKKKNGFKPLIITVCSIFGVGIIGLAVLAVLQMTGVWSFTQNGTTGSLGTTSNTAVNPNGPTLGIANQPKTSDTAAPTGAEMNATQVATKLTPEVVGIVDYSLQSVEPTAEGSGIVMTADGYIITNEHVIDGAQKIRVVMSNGKTYDNVKVVGSDTQTDLAVLKINATGLSYASFGDSTQLKVGQAVIAIGNPGGLELASTVTNGIVSGLNRSISETSSSMTYIQTNALINPGNSAAQLVNMYGQVVGINCSKIETENGQTFEGIGFAIPINSAQPIINSIIKYGYVTGRVKIGISIYPLSNSQAQWYNYPSGLYVEDIDQTSDAYAKGLRDKDIITKINGVSIADDDADTVYSKFYTEETKHKVGDTVTLTVYQTDTGNTVTISVKLAEDKGDDSSVSSSDNSQQVIPGTSGSFRR